MTSAKDLIKTSNPQWLKEVLRCCRDKTLFTLVDDANLGFTEDDFKDGMSILAHANRRGIPWNTIAQALAGIGFCGIGIWLIRIAVIDPEPTSKLTLLLAGGILCILVGGAVVFSALNAPINVKGKLGDDFDWEFSCSF